MAVTPTGFLSTPVDTLRTMLANSAAFQTWVGAADATAAKARIYPFTIDEGSYTRPYAIVTFGDGGFSLNNVGTGAADSFQDRGQLRIFFEANVSAGNQGNHADSVYEFTNQIGAVLSDIAALAVSGYLVISSFRVSVPSRSDAEEKDAGADYFNVVVEVEYGIEG